MSVEEGTINKSFVTIVATVALFLLINASMLLRNDSPKMVESPRIRPPSMAEYMSVKYIQHTLLSHKSNTS